MKTIQTESLRFTKHHIYYIPIRWSVRRKANDLATEFLDDHRALEPPDPIPNSVVKRCIADGSVGFPHVRVGHRQVVNVEPRAEWLGVLFLDLI